jgi:membrane protein
VLRARSGQWLFKCGANLVWSVVSPFEFNAGVNRLPGSSAGKSALAWFRASRPWRAWSRYSAARGSVLAAGVGYFAFFSIFPAVALAFSVFGFVLRGHPDLLSSVNDQLDAYLPGLIRDAQHPEGLVQFQVPDALPLTVTGAIAFVTLVLAGLGWLGAVREGIRAVFGAAGPVGNMITSKLRDLGVLFTLGAGIALLAVLTSTIAATTGWIAQAIGLPGDGWLVSLGDLALSVLADTALMTILLRVVSGVKVPWRELSNGALLGGVGFTLLKLSAGALLPRLTANPLFASFAVVVGLLVWINLIARLTLIAAAWAANDIDAIHGRAVQANARASSDPPDTEGALQATAAHDRSLPTFGARSTDRVVLGAGLVLGATAMAVTGALIRGTQSVIHLVKG